MQAEFQVAPGDLRQAILLADDLEDAFVPQHHATRAVVAFGDIALSDTYRTNLRAMIQAKIDGQEVVETPETHIAPVIDIMEALRRSLEMRKPPMVASAATGDADVAEDAAPDRVRKARSA